MLALLIILGIGLSQTSNAFFFPVPDKNWTVAHPQEVLPKQFVLVTDLENLWCTYIDDSDVFPVALDMLKTPVCARPIQSVNIIICSDIENRPMRCWQQTPPAVTPHVLEESGSGSGSGLASGLTSLQS